MPKSNFILHNGYREYPEDVMRSRLLDLYTDMKRRRSVRQFSERPVPRDIVENCVKTASTAPSGANLQPWHFVVVSDSNTKRKIHAEAEAVEHDFYHNQSSKKWVEDLKHLGTTDQKSFLLTAPYLIVIFAQRHGVTSSGQPRKHYYVTESVGIATGMLITAIHRAGLVCLTYTPGKMGFLNRILSRPTNEKPFMILVVGYPQEGTLIPDIKRKSFQEIVTFV